MASSSSAKILDVPEHLDGFPNVIEALNLGWQDYTSHLEGGKHEGEDDHVKQVDEDDVEEPAHHIVLRVEDVEDQYEHSHNEEHWEANKIADCVSPAHVTIDHLKSLVDLLGSHSSHHLS